jgi:hypothetical protein
MGLFVDLMVRERAVGIWRLKVRLRELVLEKTRGASRISVGEDKGRGNEDDLFAYKSAG